jgi:hypothetical protein
MFAKVFAAFFHLDEHDGLPHVISERGPTAVLLGFAYAELRLAADFENAALTTRLKEPVEKYLSLTFFVTPDVLSGPGDKCREPFFACFVHDESMNDRKQEFTSAFSDRVGTWQASNENAR